MTRRFAAPRERVFDAWTEPELLRRWWAALEGWETSLAEVDLRPLGRFRLSMRDSAGGAVHTVTGRTLVSVDFVNGGDGTQVILTHGGFADTPIRDLHRERWAGCLANLERRVFGKEQTA